MDAIRDAICEVVDEHHPMTVRQVFYAMTVRGVVPKTESGYGTVQRQVKRLRHRGRVPWEHIVDSSRAIIRPRTFGSMKEALRDTARMYRRSVWSEKDAFVQVWLEKRALAGVLEDVTLEWDVPLFPSGGFTSLSYQRIAFNQIQRAQEHGKDVYLYDFGDHDPSGVSAWQTIQNQFEKWGIEGVTYERVAVTPEQIERWNLPSRPTKATDQRASWQGGDSTELDAIPPDELKRLVHSCITRHIPPDELERIRQVEQQERQTLEHIAERMAA